MTDQKPTGSGEATKALAKAATARNYVVLEHTEKTDDETNRQQYVFITTVKASDEKEARWKAVDATPELKSRVQDDEQHVILVAISDRNWTPRETAEEVVKTTKRT